MTEVNVSLSLPAMTARRAGRPRGRRPGPGLARSRPEGALEQHAVHAASLPPDADDLGSYRVGRASILAVSRRRNGTSRRMECLAAPISCRQLRLSAT